jgi:hypothetical protein
MDYLEDLQTKAREAKRGGLIDLLIEHAIYPRAVQAIVEGVQMDCEGLAEDKQDLFRWVQKRDVLIAFFEGAEPFVELQARMDYLAGLAKGVVKYESIRTDFASSAASGAVLAAQERKARPPEARLNQEDFKRLAGPIYDAVRALNQGICSTYFNFKKDQELETGITGYGILEIYQSRENERYYYSVTIDADRKFAIWAEPRATPAKEFEGEGKTWEDALRSIAAIAGYHYHDPHYTKLIDNKINRLIKAYKSAAEEQRKRAAKLAAKEHKRRPAVTSSPAASAP